MKRIGVTFQGCDPAHPSTWSGTPYGVMTGLQAAGVEPVAMRIGPPPLQRELALNALAVPYLRPTGNWRDAVRRARAAAAVSPALSSLDSMASSRVLHKSMKLDGIVQIGAGYMLRTDAPIVTYEDMTVEQTKMFPYRGWDLLSERAFKSRVQLQRAVYQQAVACCLTSQWAARSVIDDYGVPAEKVHAVGVGCNHSAPQLPRDWGTPRFLFVGIDWERKNGAGVLQAFRSVRKIIPAATLDVVGRHPPLCEDGVTTHGVLRLDIPAEEERLSHLFAKTTCFVMPSFSEACGIAYVEAATAGIPSIGTVRGGSDFLIGDGGLVIDPYDIQALESAMIRLCDPATAARMGSAAKARSVSFTWPAIAERLLRALDGVSAAGCAPGRSVRRSRA
jgi:glycosyltransferase involved in cell wall biosynthesis